MAIVELFMLDGSISSWASKLPAEFSYSNQNLYEQLVVKQQQNFILVHALFQQCRLILHASLVPQFSGVPLQDAIPIEAVRLSAQIALTSAQKMSEMGGDLLALEWDPAQVCRSRPRM
jgi:hypothetical protein